MTHTDSPALGPALLERATRLDAADPLREHREAFVPSEEVDAYLDGNSLGRPLRVTAERLRTFVEEPWGGRLIRGWDEGWMEAPVRVGDRIAALLLGAGAGQTFVGDSTTVLLYKLMAAAAEARAADRDEIVVDTENFPTDRFVADGVAAARGMRLRWIEPDPHGGVTVDQVREAVSERTALVVLSQVAYKSAYLADVQAVTRLAHDAGALVLWDLCHSVGSVPIELDAWGVDLAVGCTYKYLNGGPGAPAFGYVAASLQERLQQPIRGWMGAQDPFAMGERYQPATGIRRFLSGTPSILAMVPLLDMLDLIETVGMPAVRAKSVQLTRYALEVAEEVLLPAGVRLASPREPELRGGHLTFEHPRFRAVIAEAWRHGVIPDFRPPQGLRVGLSPLSTGFAEVARGLSAIAELLAAAED